MTLPTVDSLNPVAFRCHRDTRGALVAIDLPGAVPFSVARAFWVFDVPANTVRGAHAHRQCQQFLVCVTGSVTVELFDGAAERSIALAEGRALYVPPGIFATERYIAPGSVLMVFCDRPYEPADYLTDRADFLAHRRQMEAG